MFLWIWLLVFIIITFVLTMLIITPYENEEVQQKVMMICGIIFNLLFGTFTPMLVVRLFPIIRLDISFIKYILRPTFLVPVFIYFGLFLLLNILFKKKSNTDLKKYLTWNVAAVTVGYFIIIVLSSINGLHFISWILMILQ